MYDAIDDPYTYEGSTVLRNKLGLTDAQELEDFEAEISAQRATESLPTGSLDFPHYCAVHHHLFQDVFEWAGKPRTVRIAKGGSQFCYPEYIEAEATKLFSQLKSDDYLRGLTTETFAGKAATFLTELNAIHAFREGNGRTQLTFFALLADTAGHPLNIDNLNPDALLRAMIASFGGDETSLRAEILRLVQGS